MNSFSASDLLNEQTCFCVKPVASLAADKLIPSSKPIGIAIRSVVTVASIVLSSFSIITPKVHEDISDIFDTPITSIIEGTMEQCFTTNKNDVDVKDMSTDK